MSDRVRSGAAGVLVVGLLLLAATAWLVVGWLNEARPFVASVPQPSPLVSTPVIPVKPGNSVCIDSAVVTPRSEVATFRIGTRRRPGVDLSTSLRGPGYESRDRIPGRAWKDNDLLQVDLRRPERPVEATFCVRNDGRRTVDFYGADDRSKTMAITRVAGRRVVPNLQLAFIEREPATLGRRVGDIAEELSTFRPGVVTPATVWIVAILTVVGLPLLLILAMWRAVREPDPVDDGSGSGH